MKSSRHRIVCAASVAEGMGILSRLGEVEVIPETEIDRAAIRGADALVSRSKVRVNDDLLDGSSLRFYGTTTAGFDHVDAEALARRGIAWTSAPGCNANSVAEYVVAVLLRYARRSGRPLRGLTLGIIGAGHVGSRLAALAPLLGFAVRRNDPPLRASTGRDEYEPLEDVLAHADILSLHVPLEDATAWPTRGMVDAAFLDTWKNGALFINASRGEVVQESAYLAARASGAIPEAVLDVFDHEPAVDPRMIESAAIATPHIAGYSYDGRVKGTLQVARSLAAAFGMDLPETMSTPGMDQRFPLELDPGSPVDDIVQASVTAAYDVEADDRNFRPAAGLTEPERAALFKKLRAEYPERYEFHHYRARLPEGHPAAAMLAGLGFEVVPC